MEENEVMNQDIYFEEEQQDISVTVDIIDVSDATTYTVDTLDAFPAVGEGNEHLRHSLMNEREIADQHPITAITGLREELDYIESLKTVYSDKRNQANYYLWKDENILQEDRVGYFVSACSDINEIEMCKSNGDILGVTVDSAGFVGAQSDIARDIRYGLVVSSGMVHVRCESTVGVGDYVISNDYGYAQKNNSGYKVVGRHQIDGVEYAEIALVTPIGRICELSDDVESISARMDDAETNIVAAINIANAAYNKASEAGDISEEAIKNAIEALEKSDETADKTDKLETSVSSANEIAVQAKTIAEGAALSAITLRNEAIENANKALQDTSELRDDFKNTTEKMDNDLQSAILDIRSLEGDLAPLAIWPQDSGIENANGVAGFVAKANEDSATLASVTKFEGEFGKSLTGFVQEATEENSTVKALAAYEQKDEDGNVISKGAAGLISQVDANKSSISAIAEFNGDIAGLKSQVDKNTANVSIVASKVSKDYVIVDSWQSEDKYTHTVYYAKDTKLYWYYRYSQWNSTDDASIAGLPSSVAGIQVETDDHSSKIDSLVDWQGETKESMARIEQKADANGASINLMVSSVDKYSVGEYSQAYGLTRAQAKSILKVGMIYVPTKHNDSDSHSETFGDETEPQWFTPHNYYEWNGNDWIEYGNSVAFFSEEPTPSRVLKYWYIDSDEAPEGYEPYALYIWEDEQWTKVNILAGNANNRIISMINQTTNKIASDIVDAQGDIASHQQWLDTNSANIQDVVSWKSDVEDDVSNIATIKQTADAAGASVAMVASEICGEYATIDGTWSETDKDISKVYYTTEDKKYWYYKSGVWNSTYYPTEAGLKVNGSSIVTAINNGETSVRINGDNIILNGAITNDGGTFYISEDGNMTATGGQIGGWKIHTDYIGTDFGAVNTTFFLSQTGKKAYWDDTLTPVVNGSTTGPNWLMYFNGKFGVTEAGNLYARNADISGTITATGGYIGGWNLVNNIWDASLLYTKTTYGTGVSGAANNEFASTAFPAFWAGYTGNYAHPYNAGINGEDWRSKTKFYVQHDGKLYATGADISGRIDADNGFIGGWTITSDGIENVTEEVHNDGAGIPIWVTGDYIAIHSNGTILSADVDGYGSSIKEIVNNPSQADRYYETKISSGKLKISRFGADWSEGSVEEEPFMEYDCYGMRFEIYIDTEDNNVVKARIKGT